MEYDYERMARLHSYVYSAPADSAERERRLNELNDADQAALYDYAVGLLSGRIKPEQQYEYHQEEKGSENMTYKKWKEVNKSNDLRDMNVAIDFRVQHPALENEYKQRQKAEQAKRDEIMKIKDVSERTRMIAYNLSLFD